MWNVNDLFVLSDLHLAPERGEGLFQADYELAECLRWILLETRDSVVVLAGDVLDFLVLNHEETFDDFDSLAERTTDIIDHHQEVFDALAELVQSPRHGVIIMGGNHDPELIFPSVQEAVERRLGTHFGLPKIRWLVQGEALRLRVGSAVVLVEHGNVLDPWNRVNHGHLQSAFSLASRNLADVSDYQPPLGSRLVLEVVNELRRSYGWVNCLKPETQAVVPLIFRFASRKQRKLIFNLAEDYLSMRSVAINRKIGNLRRPERLYRGEKEARNSGKDEEFKQWLYATNDSRRLSLVRGSEDDRLVEKLRLVSAQDTFFDIDKPDDSIDYLSPVFEGGADIVIHGHTHSAKACPVEGGLYVNTGTWSQLLRLPKSYESDQVWRGFLDLLRANDVQTFNRPTFARVRREDDQDATTAALQEWRPANGPKALAARRFSERRSGWQKEG